MVTIPLLRKALQQDSESQLVARCTNEAEGPARVRIAHLQGD